MPCRPNYPSRVECLQAIIDCYRSITLKPEAVEKYPG
jgi:hypothetical protein